LFPAHSTAFASSMAWVCRSVYEALLRPIQSLQRCLASASQYGSMSAVALGVFTARWRIVLASQFDRLCLIHSYGKVT
jgi:hypothetical protein